MASGRCVGVVAAGFFCNLRTVLGAVWGLSEGCFEMLSEVPGCTDGDGAPCGRVFGVAGNLLRNPRRESRD